MGQAAMVKFGKEILLVEFLDEFECGSPWPTFPCHMCLKMSHIDLLFDPHCRIKLLDYSLDLLLSYMYVIARVVTEGP